MLPSNSAAQGERTSTGPLALVCTLVLLCLVLVIVVWRMQTPPPLGQNAPPNQFSAGRAAAILSSLLGSFTYATGAANDLFTLDLTYGNPLPAAGANIIPGDGFDSLVITGMPVSESLSLGGSTVFFPADGNGVLTCPTLELLTVNTGGGNDVIALTQTQLVARIADSTEEVSSLKETIAALEMKNASMSYTVQGMQSNWLSMTAQQAPKTVPSPPPIAPASPVERIAPQLPPVAPPESAPNSSSVSVMITPSNRHHSISVRLPPMSSEPEKSK